MNEVMEKRVITAKDYEERKNNALNKIANTTYKTSNGTTYKYTRKELEETFDIEDTQQKHDRYDNYFLDGNYIFHPLDKTILI